MTTPCSQEGVIARIESTLERVEKDINGNGKKGLRDTVTILTQKMDRLEALEISMNKIHDELSTLVTVKKYNAKVFGIILSIIGLILTASIVFQKLIFT